MPWVVVKFIDTNEVEAVPVCWLVSGKNDEVLWPPNLTRSEMELALKKEIYPEKHWEEYKVKKLAPREYDSFAIASAKAAKGCMTSELENVLPEKRIPKRKIYSSSEDEISLEDDLEPPVTFPKGLKKHKQLSDNNSQVEIKEKGKKKALQHLSNRMDHNYNVKANKPLENAYESEVNRLPNDVGNIGTSDICTAAPAGENTFQKKCLQLIVKNNKLITDCDQNITELSGKVDELKEMLHTLLGNRRQDTSASDMALTDIFIKELPVKNHEQHKDIEKMLLQDNVFNYIVDGLYRIGGRDYKDCIRRFLKKMLTDDVASSYSLQGHKKKKIFSSTKVYAAVISAVQRCDKDVQLKNVELVVGQWLAKAPERLKKKETQLVNEDHEDANNEDC